MSNSEFTTETPHGFVKYRVYSCDVCGKETLNTNGWLRLQDFFDQHRFVFPTGYLTEDFQKQFCSTECLRKHFPIALKEFCDLYNARFSQQEW